MKATSLRNNKFFIAGLIVILIIFLHHTAILSPLEKVIAFALAPVQTLIYGSADKLSQELSKLTTRQGLTEENSILKEKINQLEEQIVTLKMFIEENKLMTQQNEYLKSQGLNFIQAQIIGKLPDLNPNLFIINKGVDEGIKVGMAVVVDKAVVVGKIIKTENKRSWFILLIDNQCQMSATLAGQGEVVGLVQGKHNISLGLNYILKNTQVKKGDLIVTSGLDTHIPAGLLIGEVKEMIEEENSLFKNATLNSTVNFRNLRVVSVVIN